MPVWCLCEQVLLNPKKNKALDPRTGVSSKHIRFDEITNRKFSIF